MSECNKELSLLALFGEILHVYKFVKCYSQIIMFREVKTSQFTFQTQEAPFLSEHESEPDSGHVSPISHLWKPTLLDPRDLPGEKNVSPDLLDLQDNLNPQPAREEATGVDVGLQPVLKPRQVSPISSVNPAQPSSQQNDISSTRQAPLVQVQQAQHSSKANEQSTVQKDLARVTGSMSGILRLGVQSPTGQHSPRNAMVTLSHRLTQSRGMGQISPITSANSTSYSIQQSMCGFAR